MKKKGFTLIEILGVMVLLGIIALIAVPTVNSVIKNSKQKALDQTISTLESAAYRYSNRNDLGYSSKTQILKIDELKEKGYIKNDELINPTTDKELEGCVFYRWDENYKQYNFSYSESCELKDLYVNITNLTGEFNDAGWANKAFYVKIDTNGTSYSYCISDKKCYPNAVVDKSSGTAYVTVESDTVYVCAYAIDGDNTSEVVCSETYKLDTTKPTPGGYEIICEKGENGWCISDATVVVTDGYDDVSGHDSTKANKYEITENTEGEKIIISTEDIAGNVENVEIIVKLDKTNPEVNITKTVENNKNVFTATTNYITSGVSYTWYKNGNVISGETNKTLVTDTAGTYQVKIKSGAGKTAESNEITVNSYSITYDLNGGTGSISSQTKIEDLSIVLSKTTPKRDGYTFMGWGLSSTSTDVKYVSGSTYTENADLKLYAVWKKTYVVNFVSNGASITSTSASCIVYNADTGCTVKTPEITRDDFDIIGFSTNANASTKEVSHNTTITVNSNVTYYAITKKDISVKFYKNGAASQTPKGGTAKTDTYITENCTILNTATSCSITSPTINASSNTPSVVGYATSSNATSSAWDHNTAKNLTDDATYYAITKKASVTFTANFNSNGASLSSTSSLSCTISATYNGTAQATSCTVQAPTITRDGFSVIGFNTSSSSTTNNSAYSSSTGKITLNSSNTESTWYAITKKTLYAYFDKNNAYKIGSTSEDCTIYNTTSSCSITTPSITAQTNFTEKGYGSSSSTTTTSIEDNTSLTLTVNNTGNTYYALNSRYLTWSFDKNGASSIGSTSQGCTIWSTSDSCNITTPSITAASGYTKSGWGSISSSTSSTIAENTAKTLSNSTNGGTYYAVQYKTINITYNGNGADSGSVSGQSCTMYNTNTSCSVTLRANGYSKSNYSFQGWSTGTDNPEYDASTAYSFSSSLTLNAIWYPNYICSVGTLSYDASKGYICTSSNAVKRYDEDVYTRSSYYTDWDCSTDSSASSCTASSGTYAKTECSKNSTTYTAWSCSTNSSASSCSESSGTTSKTTCSKNATTYTAWNCSTDSSASSCSASSGTTSKTTCTTNPTTYTKTVSTRTHTTSGGSWCQEYSYAVLSTSRYETVDSGEAACRGNGKCEYVDCEEVNLYAYNYYTNWDDCDAVCDGSCGDSVTHADFANIKGGGTVTNYAGTHEYLCDTELPSVSTYYHCSLMKANGCAKFRSNCINISNFSSSHVAGWDYQTCTGSFYGNWTVSSTSTTTSCSASTGDTSKTECSTNATTYTKESCTRSVNPTTYTKETCTRSANPTTYTETYCTRDLEYTSWSYSETNSGLTSCTESSGTYEKTECSSYYTCPSGWSTYSGSGSSMKCYQSATLAS